MTPHPQAEILRAIADGEDIEAFYGEEWYGVMPMTALRYIYDGNIPLRIKPKTININGIEVPEPMREEPEEGTSYWTALSLIDTDVSITWNGCDWDKLWLSQGICHLTEGAAVIHREALLSFTRRI